MLFKVNNGNTTKRMCVTWTHKNDLNNDVNDIVLVFLLLTLWHRSGVFIIDFEQISHIILVFLLLTFSGWNWKMQLDIVLI